MCVTVYPHRSKGYIFIVHCRVGPGLVKCDLTDHEAVTSLLEKEKPDVIIHSAAERFPDVVEKKYEETCLLNIKSSAHIASVARKIYRYLLSSTNSLNHHLSVLSLRTLYSGAQCYSVPQLPFSYWCILKFYNDWMTNVRQSCRTYWQSHHPHQHRLCIWWHNSTLQIWCWVQPSKQVWYYQAGVRESCTGWSNWWVIG